MKFTDLTIFTNLCQEIVTPPYTMTIPKSRHEQPKPKYKFSRQWYEVVVPLSCFDYNLNPGVFKDDSRLLWCAEQFGPQPDHPDAWSRWYVQGLTIRFRDQQDYMLYLLRWA